MHEPISWLAIERHAAGEPDPQVEAAALADPATRACLEAARQARTLRALPAAVVVERPRRRWAIGAGVLAAACALVLVVVLRDGVGSRGATVKGGSELVLELVRSGDRYKVVVTCGEGWLAGEVVVRQAGVAYRPLAPVDVRCGNRVPVPGAFRITGSEAVEVCVEPADGRAAVCVGVDSRRWR